MARSRRGPAPKRKPRVAKLARFAAPTAGWQSNQNLAATESTNLVASQLINFFPGLETVKLRRGSARYATLQFSSEVAGALLTYTSGSNLKLFAASESQIYDITSPPTPNTPLTPDVGGLTNSNWSSAMFSTTGGTFLIIVNGANFMRAFDGADWYRIDGENNSTLNYDGGTVIFTVGETITGGTSGATADVKARDGNSVSGRLYIGPVTGGPFVDDEILTGSLGGAAVANGAETPAFNAITGIQTSNFSAVWAYKKRLFFAERDTLNVWYLEVDSISGAATKLPMAGEFSDGSSGILFGFSWSLGTSGQGGLSEQMVVVTKEGEVAVYQGSDPDDADNWSKVGLYNIGAPLGLNSYIRIGGDTLVATEIGLVPLSQAVQRDLSTLSVGSASFPIDPDWRELVAERGDLFWNVTVWPDENMIVVAPRTPVDGVPVVLVANSRTGAWAKYTGWDMSSVAVHDNRLFFGTPNGRVIEGNVTGADQGIAYTGAIVPLFDQMGEPASIKSAVTGRVVLREQRQSAPSLNMLFEYSETLPAVPAASPSTVPVTAPDWMSLYGRGYALSPCVQVTSNNANPTDTELVQTELMITSGEVMS